MRICMCNNHNLLYEAESLNFLCDVLVFEFSLMTLNTDCRYRLYNYMFDSYIEALYGSV